MALTDFRKQAHKRGEHNGTQDLHGLGAGALTTDAGRGRVALAGHARVCAGVVRQGQTAGHAGWETVAGRQKGTNADDWR